MGKQKFWSSDERISASWAGASGIWEKADVSELPILGRSGFWKPYARRFKSPNPHRLIDSDKRMGTVNRAYSKDDLIRVHKQLLASQQLQLPRDCEIPLCLRRQKLVLGQAEFAEDKWVCGEPSGKVWGPLSREDILRGRENGELGREVGIVPLGWIRESCVSVEVMNRMWEDVSNGLRQSNGRDCRSLSVERNKPMTVRNNSANTNASAVEQVPAHGAAKSIQLVLKGLNFTSPEIEANEFVYMDSSGSLQGPFPKKLIVNWWLQSYLPIDLKIRPSQYPKEEYVGLLGLLAKWYSGEAEWKYLDSSGNIQGPFPKTNMIEWYERDALPTDLMIRPDVWAHSSALWLDLVQVLVFWLPSSNQWECKSRDGGCLDTFSVEDVVLQWQKNYKLSKNTLHVKPVSWPGTSFFPVEKVLEGFGYLK